MSGSDNRSLSKFAADEKENFSLPGRTSVLVNSANRRRRGAKLKSRLLALRRFRTLPRHLGEKGCRSTFIHECFANAHNGADVHAVYRTAHRDAHAWIRATLERAHVWASSHISIIKAQTETSWERGFFIDFSLYWSPREGRWWCVGTVGASAQTNQVICVSDLISASSKGWWRR